MLSVVIPALDEGDRLASLLRWLVDQPEVGEIVVVDASATLPEIPDLGGTNPLKILGAHQRGRGAQMNQGACACLGDSILFLHADSRPPDGFASLISNALEQRPWGRFDIQLDHSALRYRVIEGMINLRSRLTILATGDQGIFVRRAFFEALDGYADIPLMEDVEFSKRAAEQTRPGLIRSKLLTSARRWQRNGTLKTILHMWRLRYLYWRGTDPAILATMYRDAR